MTNIIKWYKKYSSVGNWNISWQLVPFVILYKKLTKKKREYDGPDKRERSRNSS